MSALTAEGLHTYYGKSHILQGVSLEVAEGKITALLGRNGAGKTTTLRSLMGLTPAREGRVTIFGKDTTRWPPFPALTKICWSRSSAAARGPSSGSINYFLGSPNASSTADASCPAASRKCSRSAAPYCSIRNC